MYPVHDVSKVSKIQMKKLWIDSATNDDDSNDELLRFKLLLSSTIF